MKYGPLSYHTPGRVYPRDSLREPFDARKKRLRRIGVNFLSADTALDFEQSLVAAVLANTAVTALIGQAIYPDDISEGHTRGAAGIVYSIDTDDPLQSLTASTTTRNVTVTLACFSQRYATTKALAAAVETLLGNAVGRLGGYRGVLITNSICDDHKESYELQLDGAARPLRVREVTFHFSYR
jgi:hypothetical protein